jgi:hypothetical protein
LNVTVRRVASLGLDEHLLAGLLGEAGGRDGLIGGARLAVAHVLLGQHALPDGAADDGRENDEEDPSEDRALTVLGAPTTGAGGEVVVHAEQRRSGPEILPGGEPPSIGSVFLSPGARPSAARRGHPAGAARAG